MTDTTRTLESQMPTDPADTLQRVRNAANAANSWDIIHRPSSPGNFDRRLRDAARALKSLEQKLDAKPVPSATDNLRLQQLHSALNELRTESRTLRAVLAAVNGRQQQIAQLPRVISSGGHEEPRIAVAARIYLNTVDRSFAPSTFSQFVRALQTHEPLTADELWSSAVLLQFVLLESLLDDAHELSLSPQPDGPPVFSTPIQSLLSINHTDWDSLIEPLIAFDVELRQDPEGAYEKMDFESRQIYRKRVAFIARQSDCTESEVAQVALDLARDGAQRVGGDPRMQRRRSHVGYYLIDKGFPRLAQLVGFHPPVSWRIRDMLRTHAEDFYTGGVLLVSFVVAAAVLFPILPQLGSIVLLVVVFLLLVAPSVQNSSEIINQCITALYEPEQLPKLDFSEGIPPDCATLVAVPTLLLNEEQVRELVTNLEVRFLANRDPHLHFALLTDLPDSVTKPRDRDSHPLVELAIALIDQLNERYASHRNGSFLLLHRHRIFNKRQGVWMSWERKRGKLLDLNRFLAGEFDAFPIKAGRIDVLQGIRYILTLDSDTQLPRGSAARLAGAIAHPLNQAIIDPKLRIVTTGYGILQPRVGIAVRSAVRSRLAAIFSGSGGFDIYSRAVSDAYQDLFGEGIFTGKGIYEAATLHAVLDHRFPCNALLSHDLIEGAYARAGLVSDVEIIDDYPSHYGAYSRRQHRWVRGDWQIAQWMFARVPDEAGRKRPNPISVISRWKIFDNLLRSLIDPSLVVLFVAGWLRLPGGPLYWTVVVLLLLFFPAVIQFAFSLGRSIAAGQSGQYGEALSAFGRALLVRLLRLSLLLHQTWLTCDAVVRSLVRRFITGELMLEWETSAEAEMQISERRAVDRYLTATCLTALALGVVVRLFAARHIAIYCAAPILVMWALSSFVATWLSRPADEEAHLSPADKNFLLEHALRTWRYFLEFSSARHNYLIPDNVEEDGPFEAPRVSPTNLGMLLNARQAACEFGFLTVPEFAALTNLTLATIQRLEKFRGHLYNWYDTQSLQPLSPPFVSTVDSANYVASLYTLRAGARELQRTPLLHRKLFVGLRTHWSLMCTEEGVPPQLARQTVPPASATVAAWIHWMPEAEAVFSTAFGSRSPEDEHTWWLNETRKRLEAIRNLMRAYLPWMLPEYAPLRERLQLAAGASEKALSIDGATRFADELAARIADNWDTLAASPSLSALAHQLRESLTAARNNLREIASALRAIERDAEHLAEATDFSFLIHPERQVLSIGYDLAAQRIYDSCYDLFASEARLATFLAIARGDLPLQSWFKLEREHAYAAGRFLPYSWTGTSFEYLMPGLWMRSYRGTLVALSESASVHVQRTFGRSLSIPWGISESGSANKDDGGHYGYRAYGVPSIALSPEATAGPIVSPYSTFLALSADPRRALSNLRRMKSLGWVGDYGFYEAVDYTTSLRAPVLVREWMAHHQGMSLLAVANLLRDHVVQRWFHANSIIQANDLLLNEMPVSTSVLKTRRKELALRGNNG